MPKSHGQVMPLISGAWDSRRGAKTTDKYGREDPRPAFCRPGTADIWGGVASACQRPASGSQGAGQHLWPLPVRCQQKPPSFWHLKMSPGIAKYLLGGNVAPLGEPHHSTESHARNT